MYPSFFSAKLITLLIIILTLISNTYAQNWWNTSFEERQTINISYTGSATLNDFPLYINLTHTSSIQTDFEDIRFTNGSCSDTSPTQLSHEIENYSSSTNAHIWLRVPSIPTGGSSVCMYYNNSTTTFTSNPQTWNSAYEVVQGFEEIGTNDRLDSTTNGYDSTPFNFNNDEKITGIIGFADNLDGTNEYLAINSLNYNSQSISELTFCAWFRTNFIGSSYNDNWAFFDYDRSEFFNVYVRGDNGALSFSTSDGSIDDQDSTTTGLNDNSWHYGCAVYDGVDKIIYVNGEEDSRVVNAHSGANLGTTTTRFGFQGDGSEASTFNGNKNDIYYTGALDHQRYSTIARSSDWINFSYQLITNQNNLITYGPTEKIAPSLDISISSPLTSITNPVLQNKTILLNATLFCIDQGGGALNGCGNVSIFSEYNSSSSQFSNISTTNGATPLWTSSNNPNSCELNAGENCSIAWLINATGEVDSLYNLRIKAQSNYSNIGVAYSKNTTLKITIGEVIGFNQSTLTFPTFKRNSGDSTKTVNIVSFVGDNSNIDLICESGNCSEISTSFTNGILLNEGDSSTVDFTCIDDSPGNYSAQYRVTSDEDASGNLLLIECEVIPAFGPINVVLNYPAPFSTTEVFSNSTFSLNADLNCQNVCGNVSVYATYAQSPLFGTGADGELIITSQNTIINSYTYLTGNEGTGNITIQVDDASQFSQGDEVILIQMQNGSSSGVAGTYETRIISSIVSNTIEFETPLKNSFYSGAFDQQGASATQIVSVPHYTNVTINSGASITAKKWDGFSGGIVIFKSLQSINTNGYINVSEKGYRGGTCGSCGDGAWGTQGEGYLGLGGDSLSANGNGGGGGYGPSGFGGEAAGGGGHGTSGGDSVAANPSTGGNSIGSSTLDTIFLGGGGGAGGDNDGFTPFPENVDGGGIAIIYSPQIQQAKILAQGQNGFHSTSYGGTAGGGAGGSIVLVGQEINISNLNANGGTSASSSSDSDVSGSGGDGRIRLDYTTLTGAAPSPSAGFEGTISDAIESISTTPLETPLWSISQNPQWCIPSIDGSCSFSWTINASGDPGTLSRVNVFALSNITSIPSLNSSYTTINITNSPFITLLNPLNNSQFIADDSTSITWRVNGNLNNPTCTLYINSQVNETITNCPTGTNVTRNIDFSTGEYSYRVYVNDSSAVTINSSIYNFSVIKKRDVKATKEILSLGSNVYQIQLLINNSLNSTFTGRIIDFVSASANSASYSQPLDSSQIINGAEFNGELLYWNISLSPFQTTSINYSLAGIDNYSLKHNYVIGIE